MQRGSLFSKSGSWYVRYRDGEKRLSHYLGRTSMFSREEALSTKELFMEEVNKLEGTPVSLEMFVRRYLTDAPVRHSTHVGYLSLFSAYINGHPDCGLDLRRYRTKEIQDILNRVARTRSLSSRTLQHLKHFLSGVFRYAAQTGLREGNPVSEARIPAHLMPPRAVHATELEEIKLHLIHVPYPGKAAIALAAYAGLRRSEIQGLRWLDIGSDALEVNQSVVRGIVDETKTKSSRDSVPLITQLREILTGYAAHSGYLPMLAHTQLFPMSLEKLGQREIQATLAAAGLEWRGWHAYRRGLASNLLELGVDPSAIQRILRHGNLAVTLGHYAKARDKAAREAMSRLSAKLE